MPELRDEKQAQNKVQLYRPVLGDMGLETAFSEFNQMSVQLEKAWSDLETQVSQLRGELAQSRSERLRVLAEKEVLADQLKTIMSAMPSAVVVLTQDETVEEFNPSASTLLPSIKQGDDWATIAAQFVVTGSSEEEQWALDEKLYLSVRYSKLSGQPSRIAVLTDVTAIHQRSELEFRQKRLQALGDMAARLAHQIRTPLQTAMLFITQATPQSADSPVRTMPLLRAKQQLRRIEAQIESTLGFIRGESEQAEVVELNAFMRSCINSTAHRFEESEAEVRLELPETELTCSVKTASLENALVSLLDNALDACQDPPVITIRVTSQDTTVRISVTDNGDGVPAELRQRIFEPWYTTRNAGTGLGLAIVETAMAQHQGSVWLQECEGEGSCFVMEIPIDPIAGDADE